MKYNKTCHHAYFRVKLKERSGLCLSSVSDELKIHYSITKSSGCALEIFLFRHQKKYRSLEEYNQQSFLDITVHSSITYLLLAHLQLAISPGNPYSGCPRFFGPSK